MQFLFGRRWLSRRWRLRALHLLFHVVSLLTRHLAAASESFYIFCAGCGIAASATTSQRKDNDATAEIKEVLQGFVHSVNILQSNEENEICKSHFLRWTSGKRSFTGYERVASHIFNSGWLTGSGLVAIGRMDLTWPSTKRKFAVSRCGVETAPFAPFG